VKVCNFKNQPRATRLEFESNFDEMFLSRKEKVDA
jgi:hypothetical protein